MNRKIIYILLMCFFTLVSCNNKKPDRGVVESIVDFRLPSNYQEYGGVFTIKLTKKTIDAIERKRTNDSVYIVFHFPQKGVVFYPPGKMGISEYADSSGLGNLFNEDTIIKMVRTNLRLQDEISSTYKLSELTTYWWCVDKSSEEVIKKYTVIDFCDSQGSIIVQLKYIPE